ncbi:MAG: hypothetical protein MJE77_43870 [Proteobacteria bacterium]|nr:hypothetical protein [Pseudomonadota bacterium]
MAPPLSGDSLVQKLTVEKQVRRDVTLLTLSGTIDCDFDGKKLAAVIRTSRLAIHLAGVRLITSFGIREWIDFMTAAARRAEDILLLDCSPKIIQQANMVANFVGSGRIVSFYAPYRCATCGTDSRVHMHLRRDWDVVIRRVPPDRVCVNCGQNETFDDDPDTYFAYMCSQGPVALDSELAIHFKRPPRGLRVAKTVQGRSTYLRLGGVLDAFFPCDKLIDGLEGMVLVDLDLLQRVDEAGAAAWRRFLSTIAPTVEAVYLFGVPPELTEELACWDSPGARPQLATMALTYLCPRCAIVTRRTIDFVRHYDELTRGMLPTKQCSDCWGTVYPTIPDEFVAHLASIPRPDVPPRVSKFFRTLAGNEPSSLPAGAHLATRGNACSTGRAMALLAAALLAVALLALFGYHYLPSSNLGGSLGQAGASDTSARQGGQQAGK